MLYNMEKYYKSLMDLEQENNFLNCLRFKAALSYFAVCAYFAVTIFGMTAVLFTSITKEELPNELFIMLLVSGVLLVGSLVLLAIEPLKKLSHSDQIFVAIYVLRFKKPNNSAMRWLLKYIQGRFTRIHTHLSDLFIFQDAKTTTSYLQLTREIQFVFRSKTLFKNGEFKATLQEFLDTLIKLYSFVITEKRTTLLDILNEQQLNEINQQKEKTYKELEQIIGRILETKLEEPNLLKSVPDTLEQHKKPIIWLTIIVLTGIFFFFAKDLSKFAIGLIPVLIGFLFQKLQEK